MVLAANKESVQAGVPIRQFVLLLIQDTALLKGAALPFWTCIRGLAEMTARMPLSSVASSLLCLEKQNYMRSRCTNSTQDIQYPHAGIYLLSA